MAAAGCGDGAWAREMERRQGRDAEERGERGERSREERREKIREGWEGWEDGGGLVRLVSVRRGAEET